MHRLNDKGEILPRTGLNLDNFEWINVMKKVEDINIALYGSQAVKGEKRSGDEVRVWRFSWYLNGEEVEVEGSGVKHFKEDYARSVGEVEKDLLAFKFATKKEDTLEMKVVGEFVKKPCEFLLMRMVLHQCAKVGADIFRKLECEACQRKPDPAPGQKSHMRDGGCLDSMYKWASRQADDVMSVLQAEDLAFIYSTVCRFLGVSPSRALLLANAILAWVSADDVGMVLDDSDYFEEDRAPSAHVLLSKENEPLLTLVRDVFIDLKMRSVIEQRCATKKPAQ